MTPQVILHLAVSLTALCLIFVSLVGLVDVYILGATLRRRELPSDTDQVHEEDTDVCTV